VNQRRYTDALRYSATFLAVLILASCGPGHQDDMEKIEVLREKFEKLSIARTKMEYHSWVFGARSNLDSLYATDSSVFTADNILLVGRAAAAEPDSVQKKRLRYLHRALITEYLLLRTAGLRDGVANIEAEATVRIDGETIPYRQVPAMIANEPSQSRRASLAVAMNPVFDSLTTRLRRIEEANRTIARDLGFASFNAMIAEIKDISLDDLQRTCEEILTSTDSLFDALLRDMLKQKLGLTREQYYSYDGAALFRAREFDAYFPADSVLPLVRTTYRGLGIDIDAQRNLKIDATSRPTKNPRAACFTVEVPTDIRLTIKPVGGYDDVAALLHEMGHGQHYANTKEHAFEFRYLGEPTVTEAFAFLSEYLLDNQAWLRVHTKMPVPVLKDFVRFEAFHRLSYIRRYAAKFLYELRLHAGEENLPSLYMGLQSRAAGWIPTASDGKRYLIDVDDNLYSAGYLRAWFLEAQLNTKFEQDFGANWFEDTRAGDLLRSLWANGDRLDGAELVHALGDSAITPGPLMTEINSMVVLSQR
jgi:hypothetical protein